MLWHQICIFLFLEALQKLMKILKSNLLLYMGKGIIIVLVTIFQISKILNFLCQGNKQHIQILAKYAATGLFQYGKAFLESKKPIFGIVQGRATGAGFTQLALFEKFYATQNALFKAPLVQLAQGPQMCSSYTFPKIFGKKLANEIIIEGREMRTVDLQKYNFFEKCANFEDGKKKLKEYLAELNELEWNSYQECRRLMRTEEKDVLLRIHKLQADNLGERWANPELISYIFKSMQRQKSKRAKL